MDLTGGMARRHIALPNVKSGTRHIRRDTTEYRCKAGGASPFKALAFSIFLYRCSLQFRVIQAFLDVVQHITDVRQSYMLKIPKSRMASSMALSQQQPMPINVLCIDDNSHLLRIMREFLQAHGYRVLTASTGRRGLDIMATLPVNVVVLDYMMPDMDGLAVALEVRRIAPEIRIMIYSGASKYIPERLLELADKFLDKGRPLHQLAAEMEACGSWHAAAPRLRVYARYLVKIPAMLTIPRSSGALSVWLQVSNLSEGGLAGDVPTELDIEDVVCLDIMLPQVQTLLATEAAVRHCRGYYHGFEFLGIDSARRQVIRQFCETVQSQ